MRKHLSLAPFLLVLSVYGCRSEAKQAELADVEVKKVDAACATGDREKALAAMEEAARQNPAFKRAYEGTMADVPDRAAVNPCGLILADIKLRLEKMRN